MSSNETFTVTVYFAESSYLFSEHNGNLKMEDVTDLNDTGGQLQIERKDHDNKTFYFTQIERYKERRIKYDR